MNPPSNNVDKFGFPIPPKFDEPARYVPAPAASTARRKMSRWFLGLLMVVMVGTLVVESGVGSGFRMAVVQFWARRAEDKYLADDLLGALADIDHAVKWLPSEPAPDHALAVHRFRGYLRQRNQDLNGSLDDYTRLVALAPKNSWGYLLRSRVLQQMERHREAIDDLNQAVRLNPADVEVYNSRAYTRAVANVELNEALVDIERALQASPDEPNYLDTRGYIHYLLGNYDKALADLDRAIEITEEQKGHDLDFRADRGVDSRQIARLTRQWNENLSVMHHHRGQVHEKLGHPDQAQADLKLGDKLGYNPETGVY